MTTTPTDYLALCAELADRLQRAITSSKADRFYGEDRDALDRARDALAQPEPEGPTDDEILALSQWHEVSYTVSDGSVIYPMQEGTNMKDAVLSFARALLARFARPAIKPVPVAERLPGPEDCAPWPGEPNAGRWCWMASCVDNGWAWEQRTLGFLVSFPQDFTHWLPANALPVPQP